MRRLYFLLPDLDTTRAVVRELLLNHVEERHIHAIAREDMPLEDIPEANLLQKSDFVPAVERGVAVGGATGVLAGLAAVTFPPAGLVLGGGAILGIALAGAGMGAWISSMIGAAAPNSRLTQFEQAIQRGEILMLVDVPKSRVEDIEALVQQHHPEVDVGGTEPTIPAFP